jgi:hypothetical protein
MNMYSLDAPHSLTEARRRRFEVFAGQASGALQLASQQVRDSQLLSDLDRP